MQIDPFVEVVLYPVGVHDDNLTAFLLRGGKLDVLIDECDSIDIKLKLRFTARLHKIPVLMETSDRSLIDVERFDLERRSLGVEIELNLTDDAGAPAMAAG